MKLIIFFSIMQIPVRVVKKLLNTYGQEADGESIEDATEEGE